MAELIRNATGITMDAAGKLIELVQAPVGTLVEEIEGVRLVHADASARVQILILLHSHYPEKVAVPDILKSLHTQNASSVQNRLGEMRTENLLFGDKNGGYRLTHAGYSAAVTEIQRLNP